MDKSFLVKENWLILIYIFVMIDQYDPHQSHKDTNLTM